MARILTVGHGTRTLEGLLQTLAAGGRRAATPLRVIDVRRFPGSRRHPHFAAEPLARALEQAGVGYDWRGEALGGRRSGKPDSRHRAWREPAFRAYADHMESPGFQRALAELEAHARRADSGPAGGAGPSEACDTTGACDTTEVLMCAETLWWQCHRRLIADLLVLRGIEVVHLIDVRQQQPHRLHPAVRLDPAGLAVYDRGETAELFEP